MYKILVIGDSNVGKTSFTDSIEYITGGTLKREFEVSECIYRKVVEYKTSVGTIIADVYDCDEYPCDAQVYGTNAAILMYDVTSSSTRNSLLTMYRDIMNDNGFGKIPVIVVANKWELVEDEATRVHNNSLTFDCAKMETDAEGNTTVVSELHTVPHYQMSAKTGFNIEQVLLGLFSSFADEQEVTLIAPEGVTVAP